MTVNLKKNLFLLLYSAFFIMGVVFLPGCFHDVDDDDDDSSPGIPTHTVTDKNPAHIDFISAEPDTIALKNTGGPARSETSIVTFKVTNKEGEPLEDIMVKLELSTSVGDLSLSDTEGLTGSDGLVWTTVNSGTMPTHVRVKATLKDDPSINIVSDELLISTGLPDQNSIVMHPLPHNPETLYYDNVEVPVTFQAADHFNNFVPDGTVVYFTTEGGSIDDSCVLVDGVCEVTWRSGPPRPSDQYVTLLAFMIGEESFTDMDGNGLYDGPVIDRFDTATDLAEPFRDDNDDGLYALDEPWWDFNADGAYNGTPNGIYNGTLCCEEAESLGLCTRELVYVQYQELIVNSGSWAEISFSKASLDLGQGEMGFVTVSITDENGHPMPADSTIEITTKVGEIVGGSSYKIPDMLYGATELTVAVQGGTGEKAVSGALMVTVTTPKGNVTPPEYIPVTGWKE